MRLVHTHPTRPSSDNCSPRPSSLDVQFVDFDGVRFHMSTGTSKSVITLSMHIRCWEELVRYGVNDIMKREYGALLTAEPEPEYNVSLDINLDQLPPEGGKYFICYCIHWAIMACRGTGCPHQVSRTA